jgi:hypothetical protein
MYTKEVAQASMQARGEGEAVTIDMAAMEEEHEVMGDEGEGGNGERETGRILLVMGKTCPISGKLESRLSSPMREACALGLFVRRGLDDTALRRSISDRASSAA